MSRKEKLLFVCPCQFGYLTDMYKWCKYLRQDYDITVLCFDTGMERQYLDDVDIHYVDYAGSFTVRGIRFVLSCLRHILLFNGIIFIEYFEKCEWLKRILPFKKMILDVRTLAVWGTQSDRDKYDKRIEAACKKFEVVSVVSEWVKLKLNRKTQTFLLPLGADVISSSSKVIDGLRLLYVGTFDGRRIDKTIRAVAIFHHQHPDIPISYDIVGSGNHNEQEQYRRIVEELGLGNIVILHGRVPNTDLKHYFDKANIGVSFIPITDYFNIQPPTKTFEYTLSGLYTIATRTMANEAVLNSDCGHLIDDTEADFTNALNYVWTNRECIDSVAVRNAMSDYRWDKIVKQYMPAILSQCS